MKMISFLSMIDILSMNMQIFGRGLSNNSWIMSPLSALLATVPFGAGSSRNVEWSTDVTVVAQNSQEAPYPLTASWRRLPTNSFLRCVCKTSSAFLSGSVPSNSSLWAAYLAVVISRCTHWYSTTAMNDKMSIARFLYGCLKLALML